MFIICPECWRELKNTPPVCEKCGTRVDFHSRAYERKLLSVLPKADSETRAQICWVLGSRRMKSGLRPLVELLRDRNVLVRIAALRSLGEIGDPSVIHAVKELTNSEDSIVQTVARSVLKALMTAEPVR